MPHYGDVPEINKFLETTDPKYITEAIRKNPLYMHDKRIHAIIEFCQGSRAKWMNLKHKEGLDLNTFIEWSNQVFDAISKGLKSYTKFRRPHKHANPFLLTNYRDRWKHFYDKGIQVLGNRRYRKSYEKINALAKFVIEISTDLPIKIDYINLDELVSHVRKNEPLLKVLFGYLQGIVEPPRKGKRTTAKKKEKQFAYMVKKVNRILKTSKTTNETKN